MTNVERWIRLLAEGRRGRVAVEVTLCVLVMLAALRAALWVAQ
jgi:hypothetical protein